MRAVLIWMAMMGAAEAGAETLVLPSGQEVTLLEVIGNTPGSDGLALRYRFLAPAIARDGGTVDAETAAADMDWLCQDYALPKLPANGPRPAEIIISMADRDVPFGESDPEATQFFNAYSLDGANCLWEPF